MLISIVISFFVSHVTDPIIDDLFNGSTHTNYMARYVVGMLCGWGVFSILSQPMSEPDRTRARQWYGLSAVLVGLGVAARRIHSALEER